MPLKIRLTKLNRQTESRIVYNLNFHGRQKHSTALLCAQLFTSWAKFRSLKISFFCLLFLWSHFSILHNSVIWTIFLRIINSLLIKYDMKIYFSGNLSSFRDFFPDFFWIFFESSNLRIFRFQYCELYFFTEWINYLSNVVWWIFSGLFSCFRIFSGFQNFLSNFHASLTLTGMIGWFNFPISNGFLPRFLSVWFSVFWNFWRLD